MPMPNRQLTGSEQYRYGYQGEFAETDSETGKTAFQLRIYDPRIGRWLTVDPMGQYHSPYMAMDNRPNMSVDPTGGCTDCAECPEMCGEMGISSIPGGQAIWGGEDGNLFMDAAFDLSATQLNEITYSTTLFSPQNLGDNTYSKILTGLKYLNNYNNGSLPKIEMNRWVNRAPSMADVFDRSSLSEENGWKELGFMGGGGVFLGYTDRKAPTFAKITMEVDNISGDEIWVDLYNFNGIKNDYIKTKRRETADLLNPQNRPISTITFFGRDRIEWRENSVKIIRSTWKVHWEVH